jgi:hypothetical protein
MISSYEWGSSEDTCLEYLSFSSEPSQPTRAKMRRKTIIKPLGCGVREPENNQRGQETTARAPKLSGVTAMHADARFPEGLRKIRLGATLS